jgi:hypothetical protein
MPPAVGYADTSSDIAKPMSRMKMEISGQPQEIATGPAVVPGLARTSVKQPAERSR